MFINSLSLSLETENGVKFGKKTVVMGNITLFTPDFFYLTDFMPSVPTFFSRSRSNKLIDDSWFLLGRFR